MKIIPALLAASLLSIGLTACVSDGSYDRYADSRDHCDGVYTSRGTCIPETRRAPTTPD
jgi:hypothetical protein